MHVRLGDVLVRMGVLSEQQRDEVLERQVSTGRPFGVLAEELFGISPRSIERAWAAQYADMVGRVDLAGEGCDESVREVLERRQAWQFQVLPLRCEGGDLVMAASEESLSRAMRFVAWAVGMPVSFVIADERQLQERLQEAYPMPGGPEALEQFRQAV